MRFSTPSKPVKRRSLLLCSGPPPTSPATRNMELTYKIYKINKLTKGLDRVQKKKDKYRRQIDLKTFTVRSLKMQRYRQAQLKKEAPDTVSKIAVLNQEIEAYKRVYSAYENYFHKRKTELTQLLQNELPSPYTAE